MIWVVIGGTLLGLQILQPFRVTYNIMILGYYVMPSKQDMLTVALYIYHIYYNNTLFALFFIFSSPQCNNTS